MIQIFTFYEFTKITIILYVQKLVSFFTENSHEAIGFFVDSTQEYAL